MAAHPVNKVVTHDKNGTIIKGTTIDFLAKRRVFHLMKNHLQGGEVQKIDVERLKGVFFVKDFQGNKEYQEVKKFRDQPVSAKKVKAIFADGEVIYGYTHAINHDLPGFFLVPADPKSNNERIFAVFSSIVRLEVDGRNIQLRRRQVPQLDLTAYERRREQT